MRMGSLTSFSILLRIVVGETALSEWEDRLSGPLLVRFGGSGGFWEAVFPAHCPSSLPDLLKPSFAPKRGRFEKNGPSYMLNHTTSHTSLQNRRNSHSRQRRREGVGGGMRSACNIWCISPMRFITSARRRAVKAIRSALRRTRE